MGELEELKKKIRCTLIFEVIGEKESQKEKFDKI